VGAGVVMVNALRAWALGTALLVGCAAALGQITVVDDGGQRVTLAEVPQRIVSLLPSLTESVCALGACRKLVGVDRYSNFPPQVDSLPKLGSLEDTTIERIVALKPDVVLVAKSARVIDRLRGLGLVVVALESETHADVKRSLLLLAQLLGTPHEAERVWARIESDFAQAVQRVPQHCVANVCTSKSALSLMPPAKRPSSATACSVWAWATSCRWRWGLFRNSTPSSSCAAGLTS
jgi:iron complex transport system substrate-binding protein